MARVPMVTRTITTTNALTVVMNTSTNEVTETVYTLPRTYKDENAVLKVLKKTYETAENKIVYVKSMEIVETLYGMTEQQFIETAKKLDPDTRKELVGETEQ